MGEYAIYVWSAYGITLSVLAVNIFISYFERRRIKKIIKHYYESQT